jgi:hypothetical protein
MPKPNHFYSKYGGWRFGQGSASVCSLAPPAASICICQRKMIRGNPIFFVGERFHFQYLTTKKKKKNFKSQSFLFQIWTFKTWRKTHPSFAQTLDPRPPFCLPSKHGKSFLQCNPDLSTYSTIKKCSKIQAKLHQI